MNLNGFDTNKMVAGEPPFRTDNEDEVAQLEAKIEDLESLLLWALWHHQGASSAVGQPIRVALGIGPHDSLTVGQVHAGSEVVARLIRHNAEVRGAGGFIACVRVERRVGRQNVTTE